MDGQKLGLTFNSGYSSLADTSLYSMKYKALIFSVDEEYYKYHVSLKKYVSGDDPFTEFSPVYSNIKGGYGIFSGYVKYEKTLILK